MKLWKWMFMAIEDDAAEKRKQQGSAETARPSDVAGRAASGSDAARGDRPVERVEHMTAERYSQAELKEIAKRDLPERLHPLIDKSEVLSVSTPEHYNRMHHPREPYSAGERPVGFEENWQRPARENGCMAVVEMRLNEPLPCGQAHGVKEMDGRAVPQYGRWFGEFTPEGRSAHEARELFAQPASSPDKTHASFGQLSAGSVVYLSEAAPPMAVKDSPSSKELKGMWDHPTSTPAAGAAWTSQMAAPPLSREFEAPTFQVELKRGQDPAKHFSVDAARDGAEREKQLKHDLWH